MALLRPRQFGSNSPNSHSQASQASQASQDSQDGQDGQQRPTASMTIPPSGFTGAQTGDPFTSTTSTSSSSSQATPATTSSSPQTTLQSTTSRRTETSSTQSQSSTLLTSSTLSPSSTNTPSVAASGGGSSVNGLSTTLPASTAFGVVGASASSPSSSAASTTPAGIISGAEVKCSSLSCNPGKAAAIFVPIAIVSALLFLCVAFFCVRRRGRARLGQGLAFFSHGAETNYVSAPASSAGNSRAPSMREAGLFAGPLAAGVALGPAGAAGLTAARGNTQNHGPDFDFGLVPGALSRSSSCAAPPPYAPWRSNGLNHSAVEPTAITSLSPLAALPAAHTHNTSDPFADTANPFADENASLLSGDTAINRENGSRRSVRDNASIVSSLGDMDGVGSIQEAQIANISRGPSLTGGRSRPGGLS